MEEEVQCVDILIKKLFNNRVHMYLVPKYFFILLLVFYFLAVILA